MARLTSELTAGLLQHLLSRGGAKPHRARLGTSRWLLVRCDSATAVGGDDVLDQCYPATALAPSSLAALPASGDDSVLLTLLGDDGESVAPREGGVYECLLTGEVLGDRSGAADAEVVRTGRRRVFGVPAPEVASSDGGCVGCGWFNALTEDDCLTATVVGASGRCACGTDADSLALIPVGGLWISAPDEFTLCGSEYTLTFDPVAGTLTLTNNGGSGTGGANFVSRFPCCGCTYAKFSFGDPDLCSGTTDTDSGPCGNALEIRLQWAACPGPVTTECCPDNPVPYRLCMTISGADPAVACYEGEHTLIYQSDSLLYPKWCKVFSGAACGTPLDYRGLVVTCVEGNWLVNGTGSDSPVCSDDGDGVLFGTVETVDCDPFELTGFAETSDGDRLNFTVTGQACGGASGDCCDGDVIPDGGSTSISGEGSDPPPGDCVTSVTSGTLTRISANEWTDTVQIATNGDPLPFQEYTVHLKCDGGTWIAWIDTIPQTDGVQMLVVCPSEDPSGRLVAKFSFTFAGPEPCSGSLTYYFILDP